MICQTRIFHRGNMLNTTSKAELSANEIVLTAKHRKSPMEVLEMLKCKFSHDFFYFFHGKKNCKEIFKKKDKIY